MEQNVLWKDRKRLLFFALPWTFTKYKLTDDRFFIEKGFLTVTEDEVRLYRLTDISLHRSLFQRMFGLGTIKCCSADKTLGDFEIVNIKNSREVKELISKTMEKERMAKRVISREDFGHEQGSEEDEEI